MLNGLNIGVSFNYKTDRMSGRLYERVLDSRTYHFEDPQRRNKYALVEEVVEIIEVDHVQDERLKGRTT